jgi:GTP-binding protein
MAGVTRDRVSQEVTVGGRRFELIDTGGIGLFDEALLREEIQQQIEIAIHSADAVIFMVDIRDGVLPLDYEVAKRLRALNKPVLLVANKADTLKIEYECFPFHGLGFGDPLPVSALEGRSVFEATERILERVPISHEEEEERTGIPKVAIVGKMNAGKSTLVNFLAREERVIVSEIPGTTRDSVDVRVEINGLKLLVIDTAGIRKKRSIQDSVAFYGQARSARAIRRADVVLLLLDVTEKVSAVDKRIAEAVREAYKPCILCLNKWDLAEGYTPDAFTEYLWKILPGLRFAPLAFISAKTGFNVKETLRMIPDLWKQAGERVSPSLINKVLNEAFRRRSPRTPRSKVPRIYFGTQVGVYPPSLLIFVNLPTLFGTEYKRYLEGRFRESMAFREVPIKIRFRGKE